MACSRETITKLPQLLVLWPSMDAFREDAALDGKVPSTNLVHNWKARGLPKKRLKTIVSGASRRGISITEAELEAMNRAIREREAVRAATGSERCRRNPFARLARGVCNFINPKKQASMEDSR
jgi:hypothetical protein